jgi:hypothetical protein
VLHAWKSKQTIVMKRGMSSGYGMSPKSAKKLSNLDILQKIQKTDLSCNSGRTQPYVLYVGHSVRFNIHANEERQAEHTHAIWRCKDFL